MNRGIAWSAAGLGTLPCLACCLPPIAAIGGMAAALILGFLVGQAGLAVLAVVLIGIVTIGLARSRMELRPLQRLARLGWRDRLGKERTAL